MMRIKSAFLALKKETSIFGTSSNTDYIWISNYNEFN